MVGFLVAIAVCAVGAYALSEHYPKGTGPLEALPPGIGKPSGDPTFVKAPTTGVRYKTWTWPPVGDLQFHVAARADGKLGWVSYTVNRSTGARAFVSGWTPQQGDQVGILKKDFGL